MRRSSLILFIIVLLITCLIAQPHIEYYPRSLRMELSKAGCDDCMLTEFNLPSDFSPQIQLGKFYFISCDSTGSTVKYVYVGRVNTCRAGGCADTRVQIYEQESEFFDYFILYDAAGTVKLVRVFNYQASHGQEVTAKSWLNQFINYKGDRELIGGRTVDAISGATISVDAIASDIEHQTSVLRQTISK